MAFQTFQALNDDYYTLSNLCSNPIHSKVYAMQINLFSNNKLAIIETMHGIQTSGKGPQKLFKDM